MTSNQSTFEVLQPLEREIWIGEDGSGRLRETRHEPEFFGEADRAEWRDVDYSTGTTDEVFPPGTLRYIALPPPTHRGEDLVTFIDALLPADDRGSTPARFEVVRALLAETAAPLTTQEALVDVLVTLPGVTRESAVDPAGRPCTSVSVTTSDGALRRALYFDEDGQLLGFTETLLARIPSVDAEPPVLISRVAYVQAGIVAGYDDST